MTPTMRDINKKFSVRYYLNLVLIDEEERRYFKQQVQRTTGTNAPCASKPVELGAWGLNVGCLLPHNKENTVG